MKLSLRLLVFLLLITVSASFAQTRRQLKKGYLSKFGPGAYVSYLAYVPKNYTISPDTKFPLLIFLHGLGEKAYQATDSSRLDLVKTHGPPRLIEDGMDFPFIVISPQLPFEDWEKITTDNYLTAVKRPGEFVDEIVETIKQLYRVDLDRIYMTGLSSGGAATWNYTMLHPEKVAAAIPIAAWIDNPSIGCNIAKNNIPVWAFQNQYDPKTKGTPNFINYINSCNPAPAIPAKINVYPGDSTHEGWTITYNNSGTPENIYDWLMRQSKSNIITSSTKSDNSESNSFGIFPVPAKNAITVNYFSNQTQDVELKVVNGASGILISKTISMQPGQNNFEVNISQVPNGYYVVTMSGNNKNLTKSIVVSR